MTQLKFIALLLLVFITSCSMETDIDEKFEKEYIEVEKATEGVEQEGQRAKIYADLSSKGNTEAMILLGNAYLFEEGVALNPEKAIELYNRAVNAGNYSAAESLSNVYLEGVQDDEGRVYVKADPETGLMWTYISISLSKTGFVLEKLSVSIIDEGFKESGVNVERAKSRAEAWLKKHSK